MKSRKKCVEILIFTGILLLSSIGFVVVRAGRLQEMLLREQTPSFTDARTLKKYLSAMNRLNTIQKELSGLCRDRADGDDMEHCLKLPEFEEASFTTKARRPDQIPYLYEGDIVLNDQQIEEIMEEAERQLIIANKNGRVNRSSILAGIANWQQNTCITFQEFRTLPSSRPGLQFIFGSGCHSNVGKNPNGRLQQISIGNGCDNPFIVSHEIAHALGAYHEQARFDRDQFVRILPQNILPGFLNQFIKQSAQSMTNFGVEYDLGSVMHYDPFAFAVDGVPSIRSLDTNYQNTIGQRFQLSFNDVKKMNIAYCDRICKTKLPCLRSGYTDPKNCARCRCPSGLGGRLCGEVLRTRRNCGQLVLSATAQQKTLTQSGSGDCNYIIQASANSLVQITLELVKFDGSTPCRQEAYVEIRYRTDLGSTGSMFCQTSRSSFVSRSPEVLVLYRSNSEQASFRLRYRRIARTREDDEMDSSMRDSEDYNSAGDPFEEYRGYVFAEGNVLATGKKVTSRPILIRNSINDGDNEDE